ncbi:MAG: hypothetical protein Q8O85_07465, partial [Rhodoferax sp.]|uniref:hypothetical protein n=1 Tax=Rhodoferax sp. TaxID=50421 RepID=UPI0027369159
VLKNATISDGVEFKAAVYEVDQNGDYVLDVNGNAIIVTPAVLMDHVASVEVWSNAAPYFNTSTIGVSFNFNFLPETATQFWVASPGLSAPSPLDNNYQYEPSGIGAITGTGAMAGASKLGTVYFQLASTVNSFQFALESLSTTSDGNTWSAKILYPSVVSVGSQLADSALQVVADISVMGSGDNQIHTLATYDQASNTTHFMAQYDTNSAAGTTALSDIIALNFDGDVTANLTPAHLNFI